MVRVPTVGFLPGLLSGLLAAGCGPAPRGHARYDLGGGRYFVEIEDTQGGASLATRSAGEGTKVTAERHEVTWGGSRRLLIEDGRLTVDGAGRGELRPGDRVVVAASGDVLVNGGRR